MKIALVEDEERWVKTFKEYVGNYAEETREEILVECFSDGMEFISDFKGGYDLIFMDIAMPHMNGLQAARLLREKDANVCLIFITTLSQYAIKGYEVNAFDFIVKPVSYELFKIKLAKAVAHAGANAKTCYTVVSAGVMRKVPLAEIKYVESVKHYVYFHTGGEELKMRSSLDKIKGFFKEHSFAEINRSILVNLACVDGYSNSEVSVAGEKLPLSRIYKAQFLNELTAYIGGKC